MNIQFGQSIITVSQKYQPLLEQASRFASMCYGNEVTDILSIRTVLATEEGMIALEVSGHSEKGRILEECVIAGIVSIIQGKHIFYSVSSNLRGILSKLAEYNYAGKTGNK